MRMQANAITSLRYLAEPDSDQALTPPRAAPPAPSASYWGRTLKHGHLLCMAAGITRQRGFLALANNLARELRAHYVAHGFAGVHFSGG